LLRQLINNAAFLTSLEKFLFRKILKEQGRKLLVSHHARGTLSFHAFEEKQIFTNIFD
jgi:hypothetical protein